MDTVHANPRSVDEYIQSFPADVQEKLEAIRAAVRMIVPEAEEKISYQMPTFFLNGNLIHFAAFKNHIGLYPTPSGIEAFEEDLKPYRRAKGSVQFPLQDPLPMELIRRIIAYRVAENLNKPVKRAAARK